MKLNFLKFSLEQWRHSQRDESAGDEYEEESNPDSRKLWRSKSTDRNCAAHSAGTTADCSNSQQSKQSDYDGQQ